MLQLVSFKFINQILFYIINQETLAWSCRIIFIYPNILLRVLNNLFHSWIILIYLNILLKVLNILFHIVFIGNKRSHNDISTDNNISTDNDISTDNEDVDSEDSNSDTTPTNEKVSDGDVTPNETINDITDMKHTHKQIERVLKGEEINKEDWDNIKEEYSSFFGEESGNTTDKESLTQIKDYLEGELNTSLNKASMDGLRKALEEVLNEIPKESSEETSDEPLHKKARISEKSYSTESEIKDSEGSSSGDNAPKCNEGSSPLKPVAHSVVDTTENRSLSYLSLLDYFDTDTEEFTEVLAIIVILSVIPAILYIIYHKLKKGN